MNRALIKSFASLSVLHAANYVLPLIVTPHLTRSLGVEAWGELSIALAISQYLSIIVDFGFGLSASRQIAAAKAEEISEIFWATFNAKMLLVTLSFALLLSVTLLPPLVVHKTTLAVSFIAVVGTWLFPVWYFQGLQRMVTVSLINVAARTAVLPLLFVFISRAEDVMISVLIMCSGTLIAGLGGSYAAYRTKLIGPYIFDLKKAWSCSREAFPLFLSTAGVTLYTASNLILLGAVTGVDQVGYFAGADKIRVAALGLIAVLTSALFATAVRSSESAWPTLIGEIRRYWVQVALGVVLFLILFTFPDVICRIVLGPALAHAGNSLRILSPLGLLIPLSHIVGVHGLVARGYSKLFAKAVLMGGLTNLLLMPLFGHRYGAEGASMAIVIVEGIVLTSLFIARARAKQDERNTIAGSA